MGLPTTRFHAASNRADENYLPYLLCTKTMSISKESYGYGEFKNVIVLSVQ